MSALLSSVVGLGLGLVPKGISLIESYFNHKRNVELIQLHQSFVAANPETPSTPTPEPPSDNGNPVLPDSDVLCPKLDCLKISIRPVITYALFFFFLVTKFTLLFAMIHGGINIQYVQNQILDENTVSFLSLLIAFWFGSRSIEIKKNGSTTK